MASRTGSATAPTTSGSPRRLGAFLLLALAVAAFIGGLEYAWVTYMVPRFGYLGYSYRTPSGVWMIASYAMLLVAAAFLPYRTNRVSGFAVWFLYFALVVPIATIPLYGSNRAADDSFFFAAYCAAIWVLLALMLRRPVTYIVPLRTRSAGLFWGIIVVISLATYVYVWAVFGININVMSVFDVYDTRLVYRDEVAPTAPLLGYFIMNQGNVINPLVMAIGVLRRRWPLVAVGVLGQLILYTTTGYKTVLISIPLALVIAWALRRRKGLLGVTVAIAATVLVWGSVAIDTVASFGAVDIIVSRIFQTAGYLMIHYRDVYEGAPPALWDYSFLGPLVDAPYSTSPGFHVGAIAFGRPDIQANAGLFADGYANLGLVGIAIEALALLAILMTIDSAARGLPLALTIPSALLPVFALANASPFTAILSSGFALLMVLSALLPRDYICGGSEADRSTKRSAEIPTTR
jgi:hypothetical protein